MQSISGFLKFYSKDLIINLLNDEKRLVNTINLSDDALVSVTPDVCSLRLDQCIKQAEADISLYLSNPDFDSVLVQNMVNDFTAEFVYKRRGVLPVPSSIKDACIEHRENLLAINQQKLDALSLPQFVNSSVSEVAIEETRLFDYD